MTAESRRQNLVVSGAQIEAALTRVSAAVIVRDCAGGGTEFLLAQRPQHLAELALVRGLIGLM